MKYPNNLREIRKDKNVKATDLADLLEVTFQHYYALERGDRQLSSQQLVKLAKFLQITTDEIVNYEPEENSETNEKLQRQKSLEQDNSDPYFRITQDAKKNGIPPEDFAMALDFVKRFKNKG